jgi:hypothetical protein
MELVGLGPIQRELADKMWSLDSKEEVMLWIGSLPTKRLRAMAIGIYHLILIEAMDEEMTFDDMSLAQSVIESVK